PRHAHPATRATCTPKRAVTGRMTLGNSVDRAAPGTRLTGATLQRAPTRAKVLFGTPQKLPIMCGFRAELGSFSGLAPSNLTEADLDWSPPRTRLARQPERHAKAWGNELSISWHFATGLPSLASAARRAHHAANAPRQNVETSHDGGD